MTPETPAVPPFVRLLSRYGLLASFQRALGFLALGVMLGFVALTTAPWLPLNPFAESKIVAEKDGSWSLSPPSTFRSEWGPPSELLNWLRDGRFSVEFEVTPTWDGHRFESSRIISYGGSEDEPAFMIGQARSYMLVGYRTEFAYFRNIYAVNERRHIVVATDGEQLSIIINGQLARTAPFGQQGAFPDGYLVVGNEVTGDRPFYGRYHQLRLFDDALSLKEARALYEARDASGTPAALPTELAALPHFTLRADPERQMLSLQSPSAAPLLLQRIPWPYAYKWQQPLLPYLSLANVLWDFSVNVLVTMPFGILMALWMSRRFPRLGVRSQLTIVAGLQLVVTLVVEAVQFFSMALRFANPLDVVTNVAGAALGVMLAGRVASRMGLSQDHPLVG